VFDGADLNWLSTSQTPQQLDIWWSALRAHLNQRTAIGSQPTPALTNATALAPLAGPIAREPRRTTGAFCGRCGTGRAADDAYCTGCGSAFA
jgi:hypothetical protein